MIDRVRKKRLLLAGLVICLVSLAGVCNVSAADTALENRIWDDSLFNKGTLNAARRCYDALRVEVQAQEIINGGFSEIFEEEGKRVAIPSGFGILSSGGSFANTISCEDLFFIDETAFGGKENVISSILRMGATKVSAEDLDITKTNLTVQQVDNVMTKLGYTRRKQESEERTDYVSFEWKLIQASGQEDVNKRQVRTIGLDLKTNKIDIRESTSFGVCQGITQLCDPSGWQADGVVNPKGAPVWFERIWDELSGSWVDNKIVICTFEDGCPNESDRIVEYRPQVGWSAFVSELQSKVHALGDNGNFALNPQSIYNGYYWDFVDAESETASNYVYVMEGGSASTARMTFLKNISGKSDFKLSDLYYSEENQIAYLLNTIRNNFYNEYTGPLIECGLDSGLGNRKEIKIDIDGVRKQGCGIFNDSSWYGSKTSVYGFNGTNKSKFFNADKYQNGNQPYDFIAAVDEINRIAESFPIDSSTIDNGDNGNENQDTTAGDPCWDASGLSGMNWVLCPTLYNLEGAVTGISGFIDRWMQVDNAWYTSDQDNKTYKAWALMQTIANTLLIIILLAIVFSQLTGYGIDNYGIKKMLPKLVIMAILINLSFIICQLLIDASNIAGMGLNNLLQTVGDNNFTFKELISAVGGGFLALIAGAGAASPLVLTGLVAGTGGGPIAWAVFVLALLGILVGVFIFFLMIGARMIIILLFSVISPIAFACYILPNTQRFFKTWWKVFSTALMIYPICGAMYGVSSIIRGIVYHGSGTISSPIEMNFLMGLVAVLTPVLPFYIMPTLLKNTMSALGSVGGALNSLGNSLRKGLSGAEQTMRGSETYKAGERESIRNRQLGYANRTYGRLSKRDIEGGGKGFGTNLNERDQRRMARAIETKKTLGKENMDAGAALALYEFEDKSENEMLDAWEEAYASKAEGKERRLTALTDALYSKYSVGAIANIGKRMAKHNLVDSDGNVDVGVQRSLSALGNNTVVNKAFGKDFRVKATDAFKLSTTGGKDANGHFVNLDYFSNNNGITTTHEDTLNQSSAAVERQALAGGIERTLGAGASEAILHSESNIIRNLLSDTKKRNAIEADAFFQYFKAQNPNNPYDKLQDYVDAGIANGDFIDPETGELLSDSGILAEIAKRYNKFVVNGGTTLRIPHGQALAENQYSAPNPTNNANNGGAAAGGTQFKQAEKFSDAPKPGEGETS